MFPCNFSARLEAEARKQVTAQMEAMFQVRLCGLKVKVVKVPCIMATISKLVGLPQTYPEMDRNGSYFGVL